MVGEFLSYDPYGIMFRRDDPGFRRGGEGRLRAPGDLARAGAAYNKWFIASSCPRASASTCR